MEIFGAALMGAATGILLGVGGDRLYIANPLSLLHNLLKTFIILLCFGGSAYLVTLFFGYQKIVFIVWGVAVLLLWRPSEDWSRKRRGAAGIR